MKDSITYKQAGVDIDRGNLFVECIKPLIKHTHRKEVMGSLGGFGGLFNLSMAGLKNPILVSSTDGVGTKLKIAQIMDRHDTVGFDLVAMSVNDIIVQGAEPLFFLDYLATGRINLEKHLQVIDGISRGCKEAGCALIGGETAEMPGFYANDEYDLAGFAVGVVDEEKLIDGTDIRVGDIIIGIASSGLHSNGFSLTRKILLEDGKLDLNSRMDGMEATLGEELLRPTKIYVKSVLNLIKNFNIKGIVHITGGGLIDNIPRIIPKPCRVIIKTGNWEVPLIFNIIQQMGKVEKLEMFRVFNMGLGLLLIVSEKDVTEISERLLMLGETAYVIGHVEKKEDNDSNQVHIL